MNPKKQRGRKRLGEILVENGLIKEEDLRRALELQRDNPSRLLGEILITLNLLSHESLEENLRALIKEKPELSNHMGGWLSQDEIDNLITRIRS